MSLLHYYLRLIIFGASFIYLDWWMWGLALIMTYVYVLIGGSIGLHRLFAHKSFEAPIWFKFIAGMFATLIGAGTILQWIALHRHHHRFADTELDPHSPSRGLWRLLLAIPNEKCKPTIPIKDMKDTMVKFFHESYWSWHLLMFAFLIMFPKTMLVLYVIPSTLTCLWIVYSVYYVVHQDHGYKNFDTDDLSKNVGSKWFWILTAGEALHNNHHANPKNPSFAVKDNEFDIGWEVIRRL